MNKTRPWHTRDWFVSPWNYLAEVTNGFQFPDNIEVHDLTVRDGEQQAGILFRKEEKVRIAQQYLLPRQIRENSLRAEEIAFEDGAVRAIIRDYTREAGVRNLERQIGTVCRKVATKVAEEEDVSVHVLLDDLVATPGSSVRSAHS